MYMCRCMYVYMYMFVCMYDCMYVCICMYVYVCVMNQDSVIMFYIVVSYNLVIL